MKPIRCIECYKNRAGGRCEFCPLHKSNNKRYIPIEEGWYIEKKRNKQLIHPLFS